MGHRQQMTNKDRLEWDIMQYKARKDANRGRNYEYWHEGKHGKLLNAGWHLWLDFKKYPAHATNSEREALVIIDKLRLEGNHARIICGYIKNVQRIKMYSVIYKIKKSEQDLLINKISLEGVDNILNSI